MSNRSLNNSPQLESVKINESYDIREDEINDDFFLSYENTLEHSNSDQTNSQTRNIHHAGFTPVSTHHRTDSPELHYTQKNTSQSSNYHKQEQNFLEKINKHLQQLNPITTLSNISSSRPLPPPPPPSSPVLSNTDTITATTSGFSKYTKTDSMLFHHPSTPENIHHTFNPPVSFRNHLHSTQTNTDNTEPKLPLSTTTNTSSSQSIQHPTPVNAKHTREKLLSAFIFSNSPVSSNHNSDSDMSDHDSEQKDQHDNNYLIREHVENAFTKRNVRFKKISYEEIERSLSKYYDKNNKYSNEVDILITFMRGQKHLYNQSCYITQMKLYMLTIMALSITSFITVIAPFIQRYWWNIIFIMSGNAIATILITILKYMRYESACNTFTLIANHYDHYEHILEITSNKLVFVHDEAEQSRIVLEKMREIEFKMSETKELCPIIIPPEVQSTYPVIYQTNIFTLIKKMDLHRKTLILQLKNIKNEIRYILFKWNSIPNTDDEDTILHLTDTTFQNISNHPQMQREKIRLLFLMEQKEIVKKELCEYKDNYSQIDDLFMKEIKYAEMNRHWSRILCCNTKKIQYQSYTNPVIKEHLELILAN